MPLHFHSKKDGCRFAVGPNDNTLYAMAVCTVATTMLRNAAPLYSPTVENMLPLPDNVKRDVLSKFYGNSNYNK